MTGAGRGSTTDPAGGGIGLVVLRASAGTATIPTTRQIRAVRSEDRARPLSHADPAGRPALRPRRGGATPVASIRRTVLERDVVVGAGLTVVIPPTAATAATAARTARTAAEVTATKRLGTRVAVEAAS